MGEKRFTYLNTTGWNKDGFLNVMNGLNEKNKKLQKENEQLKQELFEAEKDYLIETYFDNPVRRDDKIESLKKEFKERFRRDFE